MKRSFVIALALVTLLLSGFFSDSDTDAQTMSEYCQLPPFVSIAVDPNLLFVVDVSGSMSWKAYSYPDTTTTPYNPSKSYEGYFTPSKSYTLVSGIYEETTPTGVPCTCTCTSWRCRNSDTGGCVWHGGGCSRWGCCRTETCTGDCNIDSGNYLNYLHMVRMDLVRWAMTGGTPTSCSGHTFDPTYCDPELWTGNLTKVGNACNDSLVIGGSTPNGGCILESYDGTQVKVPWDRVNAGLTFKFKDLALKPRMGGMFFSGTSVRSQKVYLGDFIDTGSKNDNFPYMNLITHINSASPSDSTPTGSAMWDAFNYFSQNSPEYGGFTKSNASNLWRNPMYVCDQNKANCQLVPCANNFVLLMSDGQWNTPSCSIGNNPSCSTHTSADPVVPGYCMHMGFQNTMTGVNTKVTSIYTLGMFLGGTGEQAMKNVAMYGTFDNITKTWPGNLTGYPNDTCSMDDCGSGKGSPCEPLPSSSSDWDKDGNSLPDTFYKADGALGIKDTISDAILDILRRTASGTAVSILASGEGSGANLLQAFFYPKKAFDESEVDWTGEMQNLWYYLDPRLQNSTIREDTVLDKILNLQEDNIIHFRFDTDFNKTRADRYNNAGTFQDTVDLEYVKNLWEAGIILWKRDLNSDPRTIHTTLNGTALTNFLSLDPSNATVRGYLQAADSAEATKIINYINGIDQSGYRSRTGIITAVDGTPRVWKLGDIISSTPKLQSWVALNSYHNEAPFGYSDSAYQKFIDSVNYKNRGMIYGGSNGGMLHAFKLGLLEMINDPSNPDKVAKLSGANLGREEWAFIPKNSLPYLKYLTDTNYCHLFYVDAPPYLFDASIVKSTDCAEANYWDCEKKTEVDSSNNLDLTKTSWRTILIGGMGLGGACRKTGDSCTDCVKTPTLDPTDNTKGLGYSSYFALDITDPLNPNLLWEFSDPALGFSTTGPVIVRTGDKKKNGRWVAVFASGPTGPIDTSAQQFYGKSDQNLTIFILDLKDGTLLRKMTMNGSSGTPNIPNAFGGSLFNATIDTDRWKPERTGNYHDDVIYVGYVKKAVSTWTNGGILRITTKESTNPNDWVVSTLIDNIGPVTSSIAHLQDRKNHKLWLYFGTGRYYYKIGTTIDDADSQRTLYGIKEPCYNGATDQFNNTCTSTVSGLTDATTTPPSSEPANGWYINLDPTGPSFKAERVITNPLAAFTGAVFFTSFAPTTDVCGFGGNSYLWAVGHRTGGVPPSSALFGTALVQVSTGEIREISLKTAFAERGGRRTAGFSGVPPKGQGLTVVIKPQPIKKFLHMQER